MHAWGLASKTLPIDAQPEPVNDAVGAKAAQCNGSTLCAVSAAEEGQHKALLVLDAHFNIEDTIPLDIGRRHHTLADAQAAWPADLRAGDK